MRERISEALKDAMLRQDRLRTSTLRLITAAIKDRDIAARGAGRDPVSDEDILEILAKMIKQRIESAKLYEEGYRLDLAEKERAEIDIIKAFLPKQLGEEEMRDCCAQAIKQAGAHGLRDMGKTMATLKARYAGRMDFAKASAVVKGLLQ